jgi:hypothetical protein
MVITNSTVNEMTHCVICGKRLWFENWRSFNKYAWCKKFDSEPWKQDKYTYEITPGNEITYYPRDSREQEAWFHIRCIKEKGKAERSRLNTVL